MKKTVFFVISLLVLTALACSFSASTANIAGAKMARDADGNDPTTVFAQDETFYAVVELANAPDDTKMKGIWTAVEADGIDPNSQIDEVEITSGDAKLHFELSNDKMWPVGKYKVDLFLNDELDRTLEFEVEGETAAAAEPEPTATPAPEPTSTPEPTPTETPQSLSAGDSLGGGSSTDDSSGSSSTDEEEETEPEVLPFQPEPYVHPSGAFSFAVPEGWEAGSETEFAASFGDDYSVVGAEFFNADIVYDETLMQTFIQLYLDNYPILSGEYEIITQEDQPDGSIYVAVTSESSKGAKIDSDFFFEQRDTIVFIFYFSTFTYGEIQPTWNEIIASYTVDPEAALVAAPASTPTPTPTPVPALPTPTSPPPPPTPTPVPAVNPALAPPPGQARVYLQNSFSHEYNIDFGDGGGSIQVAPGAENVYHDMPPGKYRPGLSIAGGNAINIDIEVGADQSWVLIVGPDGRLKWGQIYP